jgi:peptide/nickel transport system permease protein
MPLPISDTSSNSEYFALIGEARRMLKAGNRGEARRLAEQASVADPSKESAWLFLTFLSSGKESLAHARRALQINPSSNRAQQALAWAESQFDDRKATRVPPTTMPSNTRNVPEPATVAMQPPYTPVRQRNTTLIAGLVCVSLLILVAIIGPKLAPHDPMEERFPVVLPGKQLVQPPIPAFRYSEFPLGVDDYGRDILSRLLYGLGPTLRIVLLVVAIRLTAGILLGLWAGWSDGLAGRALDTLISACLAIPVLFIALFFIAVAGLSLGSSAFVIGLVISGWAESARLIREQARLIKTQPYIEAPRALGASGRQIVSAHILPQITPLVWILLAFEISSTLLVLASLGFLGYYINAIWMPLGDWTAIRATGKPELGQMMAIASRNMLQQPWTLLTAGALVIFIVVSFNLLGDGLRRQQQLDRQRRRKGLVGQMLEQASWWLEERWQAPTSALRRYGPTYAAGATLLVLIIAGSYYLYSTRATVNHEISVIVPGGHLWAAFTHDAQETRWTSAIGPQDPVLAWSYNASKISLTSPLVRADGTIIVAASDSVATALTPDGGILWQYTLPGVPVGNPALGSQGEIYFTDRDGRLTAIDLQGNLLWEFSPRKESVALDGPVVAHNGTIYYPTEENLLAISPGGELIWQVRLPTFSYTNSHLRLSNDDRYIFFEDTATDTRNGKLAFMPTFEASDHYIVGVDGRNYLASKVDINELVPADQAMELHPRGSIDARATDLATRMLHDAGVTANRFSWFIYSSAYEFNRVIWLDAKGELINPIDYPYMETEAVIGIDGSDVMFACGYLHDLRKLECRANRPGRQKPEWVYQFDEGSSSTGGAIIPGRLYVTTDNGMLYALEDRLK